MALYKIKDFDPDYRNHFDGDDVKDLDLYNGDQKIGSVNDVLVDEEGHFRYLVISTGAWIFGKKVMLPIGRAQIDYNARRVYAHGLSKEQVEQLPEFNESMKLDYDDEERVRGVYRSSAATDPYANAPMGLTDMRDPYSSAPLESSASLNSPIPVEGAAYTGSSAGAPTTEAFGANIDRTAERPVEDVNVVAPIDPGLATGVTPNIPPMAAAPTYDRDTYSYDLDRDLYNLDRHDDRIRLYEERLIANKRRMKAGEVAIGKHVETETARVEVPIEKERVIVERVATTDTTAVPGEAAFREGEVARVEVYEETPDVRKEAFVREEVRVKKVVDQDVVNSEEQIRREELDIDTQGRPIVDDSTTRKP